MICAVMNFIPIFPLPIVVFPGEDLNLHIFEPRYMQLINDCHAQGKSFGIPVVIEKEMKDFGTLIAITGIEKVYDSGEMDVKTRGLKIFKILEPIPVVPDKLYSGSIVHYPGNRDNGRSTLMKKVLTSVRLLHHTLNIKKDFKKEDGQLSSYDIAHSAGLSLRQEFEFLQLTDELHRQEYLKRHLNKSVPLIAEAEKLKEKIRMNGHFRKLQ